MTDINVIPVFIAGTILLVLPLDFFCELWKSPLDRRLVTPELHRQLIQGRSRAHVALCRLLQQPPHFFQIRFRRTCEPSPFGLPTVIRLQVVKSAASSCLPNSAAMGTSTLRLRSVRDSKVGLCAPLFHARTEYRWTPRNRASAATLPAKWECNIR